MLRKLGLSFCYLFLCNGLWTRHIHQTLRGVLAPASFILVSSSRPCLFISLSGCATDSGNQGRQGARARTPIACTKRSSQVKHRALWERKECTRGHCRCPLPRPAYSLNLCRPTLLKTRDYKPSTHAPSILTENCWRGMTPSGPNTLDGISLLCIF